MRRPRRLTAALTLAASAALLSSCGLPDGPPGVVVAKADRWSSATKSRHYFLTVRTAKGERKEFEAHIDDHERCNRGAHYPACKEHRA